MSSSGPKEELQSSKQSYDAQLRTIPISRLLNDDKQAITTLIDAGVQDGFFYVDLRAAETQSILDASAELTQLAEGLFDLPKEALAKFDLDVIGPSKIDGYKPAGRNTGVAAGKQDGFEIHLVRQR
jgi:isopenicillin N synthase-like dioxygenase